MKKLVIDIETVGTPWEELDPYVREYMIKGLSEGDAEEARRAGGLSPFRGKIVAIGVINIDDGRSCALYEVPGQTEIRTEKVGARTYISGSEKQILEKFWGFFESDSRFISFNGRQFDGPFLMIRSAINGLVPKRDLVGYRYGFHPNCDLREALNFFGTVNARQFKFNLDLACKAFGVETSKSEGVDGRSVETWYRAGRHRDIATYCLDDVRATAELYEKIASTLLIFNADFKAADERDKRAKIAEAAQAAQMVMLPDTFMQSVTETSLTLASSLSDEGDPQEVVAAKHQAIVLEKLVAKTREEELPEV
ncbi:MAG: ribonuclease H-like domain-containing protein [Acidobacteria bacterium]|nr:ribonuclease H-like domain-containing protein [Acidobacteriota bacterium]MBV9477475.1 ribonuclease H-like domain-containing protein [Acidobacteriota bacterium]